MKRQLVLFLTVFSALTVAWLVYGSRVVAEFAFDSQVAIDHQGTKIILTPQDSSTSQRYLLEAQQIVVERLEELQPNEQHQVIATQGQLEMQLRDFENLPYIIDIVTRKGDVEFIDGGFQPPIGKYVKTIREKPLPADTYYTLFSGQEIAAVEPPIDGQLFYKIKPKPEATQRFLDFMEAHSGGFICLVIDDQVINCSKMYVWSGDTLEILPSLSSGTGLSLSDLGVFLKSGPLPTSLQVITN
ncbi:MAG: hypothetical protein KDJ65_05865 [Anaerolineae bacterium]|nr:hypothetical protein [Anaerolineae bacterium]